MKVLVTGASGFIGKSCVEELADRGFSVRGAIRNTDKIVGSKQWEPVLVPDISDQVAWTAALRDVDAVVHLAARVHVMDERIEDPYTEYAKVNVDGTQKLLQSCADSDVQHFIYLSSIKVNGEATESFPFTADDLPAPENPYSVSKLEAELAVKRMCEEHGINWTIVRSPLVYGPGVTANFGRLVEFVRSGFPIPLGACTSRRSMIYIGNMCDVIAKILTNENSHNKTLMVSDGHDFTIPELIKGIGRALGRRPILLPVPIALLSKVAAAAGRGAEMKRLTQSLQIDITETCRTIDWQPPYGVDVALERTLENWEV